MSNILVFVIGIEDEITHIVLVIVCLEERIVVIEFDLRIIIVVKIGHIIVANDFRIRIFKGDEFDCIFIDLILLLIVIIDFRLIRRPVFIVSFCGLRLSTSKNDSG